MMQVKPKVQGFPPIPHVDMDPAKCLHDLADIADDLEAAQADVAKKSIQGMEDAATQVCASLTLLNEKAIPDCQIKISNGIQKEAGLPTPVTGIMQCITDAKNIETDVQTAIADVKK